MRPIVKWGATRVLAVGEAGADDVELEEELLDVVPQPAAATTTTPTTRK
jgi:hypothetical protein